MSETKDAEAKEVSKNEEAAKPVTKKAAKKPMPKGMKIALIVGGAILAFFVLIFIITGAATSSAAQASDEFLNAMQAGDGTTAYSLFSSEAKEQVPEDEFVALVAQIGPILNTEERTTSKEVTKDNDVEEATVVYEIDATDGETYVLAINLIKEDGEWKVLNFDSEVKE